MKYAVWLLAVYSLALTGFAGYQLARIDHLLWIINMLLQGSPH